ncbi:Disease resistance-responsive family protein [Hibiscus syriacus]|uniref:Dirigent protein n=1 Tax=Hibiscus syriacus TaxID=106335 RepID=A0A6A2WE51_HIBSY|nr:dirigent protein 4-like [Hibiscus syriacus]KAE8655551.1 Disease resistance-responsive family protein [Hibiscus syriacus]
MEARSMLICIVFACDLIACCHCNYYSKTSPYTPPAQKITHLHFFFHDTISGKSPSAIKVAHPSFPTAFNDTPGPFGSVFVINDPVTVGPEKTSQVIGSAQGVWVSTGQEMLELVVTMDIGFTYGEFNGSSISLMSRNPIALNQRELPIVGGRGKFRMARGFANLTTRFFDHVKGDAMVEYHVTVIHY